MCLWNKIILNTHGNSHLYAIRKHTIKMYTKRDKLNHPVIYGPPLSRSLPPHTFCNIYTLKKKTQVERGNTDLSQATSRASFSECQAICLKAQVTSQETPAKKKRKKEDALIKIHRICSATEMDGDWGVTLHLWWEGQRLRTVLKQDSVFSCII